MKSKIYLNQFLYNYCSHSNYEKIYRSEVSKKASKIVGKILKKNDIIVYESTTYPGCTEEVCIPILEKYSKMKVINDFLVVILREKLIREI